MIVWIASYPRSGNTFFRLILKHRYGIKTYSVYDDPTLDQQGVSSIVGHTHMEQTLPEMAASDQLYLVKTHEPPHDYNPAIYLLRDGRDALVSHARYYESFGTKKNTIRFKLRNRIGQGSFSKTLERLLENPSEFGSWSDHVLQWHKRPAPITTIKYEELLTDPFGQTDRTMDSLDCDLKPVCHDDLPTFETLHQRSPQFFRKGRKGSWKSEMSDRLHELFWRHNHEAMTAMGYHRQEKLAA